MRRPVIELSECILCGICESVYPSGFRLNAVGYIEVIELSDYPVEEVDDAIKNCPANCITWGEKD